MNFFKTFGFHFLRVLNPVSSDSFDCVCDEFSFPDLLNKYMKKICVIYIKLSYDPYSITHETCSFSCAQV